LCLGRKRLREEAPIDGHRFVRQSTAWFAGILAVGAAVLIGTSAVLHRAAGDQRIARIRDAERHAVGMRQDAVTEIIEASVSDLLFLSELNELGPFLWDHATENRDPLSNELVAFAQRQGIYDRIRILSPIGMENLRIDYRMGVPRIVPLGELEYIGDAFDPDELLRCAPGSVHVSTVDRTSGNGEAEAPLRLGLALGNADDVRGFLFLDLRRDIVFDAYFEAHPDDRAKPFLVDEDGQALEQLGSDPEDVPDGAGSTRTPFAARFPDAWREISHTAAGQLMTEDGLFTFDTLVAYEIADALRCAVTGFAPGPPVDSPLWKNVSWIPGSVLEGVRNDGVTQLVGWNVVGLIILGAGSWTFTRWVRRRSELHRRTAEEKELLQSTLRKYMAPEIYRRIVGDPGRHGSLGGESQEVAVLFVDIRGFTRFAESHDPTHVVAVLNRTMTELIGPLRLYGGVLDKYVGDGFLAFFEPTHNLSDAAHRAVKAARMMQRAFAGLWVAAQARTLRDLGLGIGISVGRVIVGNVGSQEAMDYTVVGDAVNVASRLQDLAGSGEILVSEKVHGLLPAETNVEPMGSRELRGRREPIDVYRLGLD